MHIVIEYSYVYVYISWAIKYMSACIHTMPVFAQTVTNMKLTKNLLHAYDFLKESSLLSLIELSLFLSWPFKHLNYHVW